MKEVAQFLWGRLKEGATWAGFAAVLGANGYVQEATVCALVAALLKEGGNA